MAQGASSGLGGRSATALSPVSAGRYAGKLHHGEGRRPNARDMHQRRLEPAPAALPERRDDVLRVGLYLLLLVAVHQVEVELIDAGIGELVEFRDMFIG